MRLVSPTTWLPEFAGQSVELAYVDQGYTGEQPARDAKQHQIELSVVKLAEAKRGFVLLPRRWVVERSLALGRKCITRSRRFQRHPGGCPGQLGGMAPAAGLVPPSDPRRDGQ